MVRFSDKQKKFDGYIEDLANATVGVVADYRGLTVAQLSDLRSQLFPLKAKFTVVKNTIMKRAIKDPSLTDKSKADLEQFFKGPQALLLGFGDEVAPVKVLKTFLQKAKIGEIHGGFIGSELLDARSAKELADLPPLDELRGKLLGCINSPLTGVVRCIGNPQQSLVNVLDQYAKKLQETA